jgi:hypothetical protein
LAGHQGADHVGGDLVTGPVAHLGGDQIRADSAALGPGGHDGLGNGHGDQVRHLGERDDLPVAPADQELVSGRFARIGTEQGQACGEPEWLHGD